MLSYLNCTWLGLAIDVICQTLCHVTACTPIMQ